MRLPKFWSGEGNHNDPLMSLTGVGALFLGYFAARHFEVPWWISIFLFILGIALLYVLNTFFVKDEATEQVADGDVNKPASESDVSPSTSLKNNVQAEYFGIEDFVTAWMSVGFIAGWIASMLGHPGASILFCGLGMAPMPLFLLFVLVFNINDDIPPCPCGETRCPWFEGVEEQSNLDSQSASFWVYRCPACGELFKTKAEDEVCYRFVGQQEVPWKRQTWRGGWRDVD